MFLSRKGLTENLKYNLLVANGLLKCHGEKRGLMVVKDIKRIAVKAIATLVVAAVVAGIGSSYTEAVDVEADSQYATLYDVFKDRSGKGDNFVSQEEFRRQVLSNCNRLNKIAYTSGIQENALACDGFVSLVFRLTFGTVHDLKKYYDYKTKNIKYRCKFDRKEEHTKCDSFVDKYEIYRPGGTSVTWLYNNYAGKIVKTRGSKRKNVDDFSNKQWVSYLQSINAQPGDIIIWDNDYNYTYWTHIGIFAGIENGVAKMWHCSSVKKKVCKQSMSEVTEDVRYLKFACVIPLTDIPAKVGFSVDLDGLEKDFSYSVYKEEECKNKIGRISSKYTLKDQSKLDDILVFPNNDKTAYEKTIYIKRDMSPYEIAATNLAEADQAVYKLIIKIEPGEKHKGVLKYSIYGAKDSRYYAGKTIEDYDYRSGGQVISIKDFR